MTKISMWHVSEGANPTRLSSAVLPSEAHLEKWVSQDPSLIRPGLQRVRNQVSLSGKKLDLLCIEAPGTWVIVEFKNAALGRSVLGQAIDYAARLSEMSFEEFKSEVLRDEKHLTELTTALIYSALELEEQGESRTIRIVVAGTDINDDLQRMIRYQSQFDVPITSCVLRVVQSPDASGHIMYREEFEEVFTESEHPEQSLTQTARLDAVFKTAAELGNREHMERICNLLSSNNQLSLVPHKRGVKVSPKTNRSRYLAYFGSRIGGVRLQYGVEPLLEFFSDIETAELEKLEQNFKTNDPEVIQHWAETLNAATCDAALIEKPGENDWNGRDWYVCFGESESGRSWQDAKNLGFVSAGGGVWYSRTLEKVPVGARIFVFVPQVGYVGCGITTGPAIDFYQSTQVTGKKLKGNYSHDNGAPEMLVPVEWLHAVDCTDALPSKGLFANQNSACKLKDQSTIEALYEFFGLKEDA